MTVQVVCPECKASLKAGAEPAQNAKLKCPKCQKSFRYSPAMLKPQTESPPQADSAQTQPRPATQSRPVTPPPPPNQPPRVSQPTVPIPQPTSAAEPAAAANKRAGRRTVLAILLCLILVASGSAYYLRGSIHKLLVDISDVKSPDPAVTATSQSKEGAGTESSAIPSAPQPLEQSASNKTLALPAVLDGAGQFDHFAFSSDQKTMVGVTNSRLEIWDVTVGKKITTLPNELGYTPRLLFSPDGQVLAVASHIEDDWNCTLWLLPDAVEVASFQWHEALGGSEGAIAQEKYSTPMAFSPSSERFAIPADNHAILVWDLTQAKPATHLTGHTGRVDDLSFTADGQKLLSSSGENQSVRLWSLDSGRGHELSRDRSAYEALLSADEKVLVTRTFDQISVWNLSPNGSLQLNYNIDWQSRHIELWPDDKTLAIFAYQVGQRPSLVMLWDIAAKKPIREITVALRAHDDVVDIQLSPDGRTIGALNNEGVALFDAGTGQVRAKYSPVPDGAQYISAFSFDDAGDSLVISMDNGKLRFEPTRSGIAGALIASDALATITPGAEPSAVHFSKDGKSLVTSLWPKPINMNDPALQKVLVSARSDFQREFSKWGGATAEQRRGLAVDFYEKQIAPRFQAIADRQNWGQVAAIWDLDAPSKPRRTICQPLISRTDFENYPGRAVQLLHGTFELLLNPYADFGDVSLDLLFCDPGDDEVLWFNRSKGFVLTDYKSARDNLIASRPSAWAACRLSPDARTMAIVVDDQNRKNRRLVLVDIEQGKERLSVPLRPNVRPAQLRFSPDSVTLVAVIPEADAIATGEHVLKLWDTATGREPNPPLNVRLMSKPESIEFSPDGTWISYADVSGPQVIDLATGRTRSTVVNDAAYLTTFSADSKELAVVVHDLGAGESLNKIHFADLGSGQIRHTISGFTTVVQSLAFSPDGRLLCIAGGDGKGEPGKARNQQSSEANATSELKLFDPKTGDLRAVLGGHSDIVTEVVFSQDGKRLASRSWDKTVKIWNIDELLASPASSPVKTRSRPPLANIKRPVRIADSSVKTADVPEASDESSKPPERVADSGRPAPAEQSAKQKSPPSGQSIRNSLGMSLVVIPAGKFRQGSPATDNTAEANERPTREVTITKPFAIGSTEVTVGQFRQFVNASGYRTDAENGEGGTGYDASAHEFIEDFRANFNWMTPGFQQTDNHPVVNISWNDANAFCEWLTQNEGVTYRLPTEAEWEYACRAGTTTRFWTGDQDGTLQNAENIGDQALQHAWSAAEWVQKWNDQYAFTAPVGSFKPNAFKLYDMHGNAGEWIADWHADDAYRQQAINDPQSPSSGDARVFRGGSWYSEPRHSRCAYRPGVYTPDLRGADTGFRVVRELE